MATPGIILIADRQFHRGEQMSLPDLQRSLQPALATRLPVFLVMSSSNSQWEQYLEETRIEWGVCPDSMMGIAYMVAFGVHSNQHWNGWIVDRVRPGFSSKESYHRLAGQLMQKTRAEPQQNAYESLYPVAINRCHGFDLMRPWHRISDYSQPWHLQAASSHYSHR
jgi:molybdenum cofactor cytidylyltransferase